MAILDYLIDESDPDAPALVPNLDRVPFEEQKPLNTREEIFAIANTVKHLEELGEEVEITEEDEQRARQIFEEAREPNQYEKTLPGVILKLEALLDEYDYSLLEDANRIRTYVANKLIEETEDPDPKIRLKAYEMLGKITEVGLFTERQEITVTQRTTPELEALLREKLERLAGTKVVEGERLDGDSVMEQAKDALEHVTADDLIDQL